MRSGVLLAAALVVVATASEAQLPAVDGYYEAREAADLAEQEEDQTERFFGEATVWEPAASAWRSSDR